MFNIEPIPAVFLMFYSYREDGFLFLSISAYLPIEIFVLLKYNQD